MSDPASRPLGILSLDTRFPRIPGDAGAPESYPFPCLVHVVGGADAPQIVQEGPVSSDLLARFIAGARALEADGAGAIVSTCGFLVTAQAEIAAAVRIPVLLSALSMYPAIRAVRPGRVGVLTASAAALGPGALSAARIDAGAVTVAGLDHQPLFAKTFLAAKAVQPATFDREAMAALVVSEAQALVTRAPEVTALILECGNLPPYAAAIRAETHLPVFTILDAARWMMAATEGGLST